LTSRDPKIIGWLDISNLSARVPLYENQVHMKVLQLPHERGSKIFREGLDYTKAMSKLSGNHVETKPATANPLNTKKPTEKQPQQQQSQPLPQPQQQKHQPQQQQQQPNKTTLNQQASATNPQKKSSMHLMDDFEEEKQETKKSNIVDIGSFGADFMESPTQSSGSEYDGLTTEQITAIKNQKLKEDMDKKAKEFKDNIEKEEKSKVDRGQAYAEFEDKIRKWAFQGSQRNNVTTLLITVHEICWPNCEWKPLSLSDCLNPSQIQKNYFKAIRFFHPDKNQHADFRQKYIAERVFNLINDAWNEHKSKQ